MMAKISPDRTIPASQVHHLRLRLCEVSLFVTFLREAVEGWNKFESDSNKQSDGSKPYLR